MNKKSIVLILPLFLIFLTGCSRSYQLVNRMYVNELNTYDWSKFNRIGNIEIKVSQYSINDTLSELFIVKDREQTNKDTPPPKDKMYIDINTIIKNPSKKTLNVDLNKFCLIKTGDNGKVIPERINLYNVYTEEGQSGVLRNDLILTLEANAIANVAIAFEVDSDKIIYHSGMDYGNCYLRIEQSKEIAYFNIYAVLI